MTAICYVSDNNIMDFHRLHVHESMIFWRLSKNYNFSKFKSGDILFFLKKKTERNHDSEKGIVGYGLLDKEENLSLNKMWKNYGELNGFKNKEDLKSEILRLNNEEIPTKINCLHLIGVRYFSIPIYLSDLNVMIPKELASFTYIDDSVATEIMNLCQLDLWTTSISDTIVNDVEKYRIINQINQVSELISDLSYKASQLKRLKKIQTRYPGNKQLLRASNQVYYEFKNRVIYLTFINISKRIDDNYKKLLGQIELYKRVVANFDFEVEIEIYNDFKEIKIWKD